MSRRYDIDFIRVAVFPILVLYHVSLMYGSRDFLIKSPDAHPFFDIFQVLTHPWRMMLLFFVSGAASAFALQKGTLAEFRMARMKQVFVPLVIGILFVIPPQIYVWLNGLDGVSISLTDVFIHYFTLSPVYLPDGRSVPMFSIQHLWYLAYLWCYTVIVTIIVARSDKLVPYVSGWLGRQLSGNKLLIYPVVFFTLARITLRPLFPPTLDLVSDWYSHVIYLSCFLAGLVLANHAGFWREIVESRRTALILALVCAPMMLALMFIEPLNDREHWDSIYNNILIGMFRWYTIVAFLGYAKHYWTKDNAAVRYLNKAILTYYIAHQTVMVLLAYWLSSIRLLRPETFILVAIATLVISGLIYEALRQVKMRFRMFAPVPQLPQA